MQKQDLVCFCMYLDNGEPLIKVSQTHPARFVKPGRANLLIHEVYVDIINTIDYVAHGAARIIVAKRQTICFLRIRQCTL
jgi:hypothetical protein